MKCPLCSTQDAACGHSYTGTPIGIPKEGTVMADQGPLFRVDTGRGHLIKMTRKQADAWYATNGGRPGPAAPEVETPAVEPEVDAEAVAPEVETKGRKGRA